MAKLKVRKSGMVSLLIVGALLTEWSYIDFMGGILRPYHLVAPVVLLLLVAHWRKMLATPVLWGLAQ